MRCRQIITGLPFEVEDWTVKDAYNGTGYWFESWSIVRKIKKKKKKSGQGGRSSRSEYKTRTVGIQNILVVQMVNVEKNHGKDKKKAAKNKTTMACSTTFLSKSSSSSDDSYYEDSSSLSSVGNRRRQANHQNNDDDPDADLSFGNDMSVKEENRRESYGTPGDGAGYQQQQEEQQQNQGMPQMFDMNRIFCGAGNGNQFI